jgi:hypothetical protein
MHRRAKTGCRPPGPDAQFFPFPADRANIGNNRIRPEESSGSEPDQAGTKIREQ